MNDRNKIIDYLYKKNIKIHVADRDKKFLNRKDYFNLLQNSKILINFNKAPNMNKIHFVGRATHAIASGCMLLEPHYTLLDRKYLTRNQDFVTYKNYTDLMEKINFYEKNIESANQISINGKKNLLKLYNESHIWKLLIEKEILNFHNAVF
jgi:spore maturation protein CgeB